MHTKIGFVGLGTMGAPMARNLLKGGCRLWVNSRRPKVRDAFAAAGATVCRELPELASAADVIITMVSDTPDVEAVVLGEGGLLDGLSPGKVIIDMSTVAPTATRAIAARLARAGVDMLDAPVSGGERGAIEGTLSIMVGGREEVLERARPVLALLGGNIVHVGDHGAGQTAKLCNQVIVGQTIAAVAEGLLLARAAGVDPARVREALRGGMAESRVLEVHAQRMLDQDYAPGFKTSLHHKDLRIAMDTAHELGVALPGTAAVAQYLNVLAGSGKGGLDSSILVEVLEQLSAKRLHP